MGSYVVSFFFVIMELWDGDLRKERGMKTKDEQAFTEQKQPQNYLSL